MTRGEGAADRVVSDEDALWTPHVRGKLPGTGHLSNAAASWQPPPAAATATAASPPAFPPPRGLRSRLLAHVESQTPPPPRATARRRYGEALRVENNFRLGRYTVRPGRNVVCLAASLRFESCGAVRAASRACALCHTTLDAFIEGGE